MDGMTTQGMLRKVVEAAKIGLLFVCKEKENKMEETTKELKAKKISQLKPETKKKWLASMMQYKKEFLAKLKAGEEVRVKLRPGNLKTGVSFMTVSLLPIIDCVKVCSKYCGKDCYDMRHDMRNACVRRDRARNSAIREFSVEMYWTQILESCIANGVHNLRLNVGGDLHDEDFDYVNWIAQKRPNMQIQFFTKNYNGLNDFTKRIGGFPDNVKCIVSAWPGVKMNNPYHYPESHIIWEDGSSTLPNYARHVSLCSGNCTVCDEKGIGCINSKRVDNEGDINYQVLFSH